jgi:mevalonate kinase
MPEPNAGRIWSGSAPGKVILFGEHAVVYGQPAIAVPVTAVSARATVAPGGRGTGVWLECSDLPAPDDCGTGCRYALRDAAFDDPLQRTVMLTLDRYGCVGEPDIVLTIASTIPIARGMGSGAAVATAVVRALAAYLGHTPMAEDVSSLVYEVEKIFHGTPSGIDNTVIAHGTPVYFTRGRGMSVLHVGAPFTLVIADSGVPSSTREVVAQVRRSWQAEPRRYDALFEAIGAVSRIARTLIETGDWQALGDLMNENQALLAQLDVSSTELDKLIAAARAAGARGAKLSGAGRGGYVLALAEPASNDAVADALRAAGAAQVMVTTVGDPATGLPWGRPGV